MWLSLSHDTRQNLPFSQHRHHHHHATQSLSPSQEVQDHPLAATLTLLRDKLQLHLVDIIGTVCGLLDYYSHP